MCKIGDVVINAYLTQCKAYAVDPKDVKHYFKWMKWAWIFFGMCLFFFLFVVTGIKVRGDEWTESPKILDTLVPLSLILFFLTLMAAFIAFAAPRGDNYAQIRHLSLGLKKALKKFVPIFGLRILRCKNEKDLNGVLWDVRNNLMEKAKEVLKAQGEMAKEPLRRELGSRYDVGIEFFRMNYDEIYAHAEPPSANKKQLPPRW